MASVNHRREDRLLDAVRSAIAFDQPLLSARVDAGRVIVDGVFCVLPTTEEHVGCGAIAQFEIKMVIDPRYPAVEPLVFETGGLIPHTADYHVNPDGSCCITIWEKWTATAPDISINGYFEGPLKNFFLGQHCKLRGEDWPFGEWRHGRDGLIDSYAETLGCPSKQENLVYLLRLLSKEWPKGHWACPCDSGLIVRDCCASRLNDLHKKIKPENARVMLKRLRQATPRAASAPRFAGRRRSSGRHG